MKRIFYLFALLLLFSCQNEFNDESKSKSQEIFKDSLFVSEEEAIKISTARPTAAMTRFFTHDKIVENCFSYQNLYADTRGVSYDIPQFYIINYKDSGFVIISADKRLLPILASSDESTFKLEDKETMPLGIVEWLETMSYVVDSLRMHNVRQRDELKLVWNSFSGEGITRSDDDDDDDYNKDGPDDEVVTPICQSLNYGYREVHAIVGPLLTTKWGQGDSYNALVPKVCGTGRAPVGCVALAMGQIMNFYKYPASYDWNAMADNWGTIASAQLLVDVGSSVGMDYDCKGSGADIDRVVPALKGTFHYTSAALKDYNYDALKGELLYSKRPAILRGGKKGFLGAYKDGHAWVCDGAKELYSYRCLYDDDLKEFYSVPIGTYLYFHMNWGWNGNNNGWYGFDDFAVDGKTFNYKRKMVINIIP